MVVFTCFEPILPPEMVVNIIGDEYMTILMYNFFLFWAFSGVLVFFGHFGGFSGDLGDFGSASEL